MSTRYNGRAIDQQLVGGDGLARDLPYVSNALKLISITRSVSDLILGKKLERFFETMQQVPVTERERMYARLLENTESAARVGEIMLLTIERLNGLDKPKWAALALIGHLDGVFSVDELRRILSAVEQTLPSDLDSLVADSSRKPSKEATQLVAFVPTGLAVVRAGGTWGDDGNMLYGSSDLGKKLAGVHRKWWSVLT